MSLSNVRRGFSENTEGKHLWVQCKYPCQNNIIFTKGIVNLYLCSSCVFTSPLGIGVFVELLSKEVTILIYTKGPNIILVSGKLSQHSQLWHHLLRDQHIICALYHHGCPHALIWFWSAHGSSTGNNLLISFCIWASGQPSFGKAYLFSPWENS